MGVLRQLRKVPAIPVLLFIAWLISVAQYGWLMRREVRGEVPHIEPAVHVARSPVSAWVLGTMLVIDCAEGTDDPEVLPAPERKQRVSQNTNGILLAMSGLLRKIRFTGLVLREGCRDLATIDVQKISETLQEASFKKSLGEHDAFDTSKLTQISMKLLGGPQLAHAGKGPHIVVKFTPFLTDTHFDQLTRYAEKGIAELGDAQGDTLSSQRKFTQPAFLSGGKYYSYKGRRGRLLDVFSSSTKAFLEVYIQRLAARGVKGLYCEPADRILKGQNRETDSSGYVRSQTEYSGEYYWTVFDLGREHIGFDFVLFGAGVTNYEGSGDLTLLPVDVGLAAIPRISEKPELNVNSTLDTAYYSFKSAKEGYLNVASPPLPLHLEGSTDGIRKALRVSAGHPLFMLHAPLDFILDATSRGYVSDIPRSTVVAAAFHAELSPYLLAEAGGAFEGNRSLIAPMSPPGEFETPTSHGFYLGRHLVVCPLLHDAAPENDCAPPDLHGWMVATERPSGDTLTTALLREAKQRHAKLAVPLVLKRRGVALPLRPFGPSPLLWGQYGLPNAPEGHALLTTVWDFPSKGSEVLVTGEARRKTMRISFGDVSPGTLPGVDNETSAALKVTPWPNRQLLVLRGLPFPPPYVVRHRREEVGVGTPVFYRYSTLEALRKAVSDDRASLGESEELDPDVSSYWTEGRDVFLFLPESPKGVHLRVFTKPRSMLE